VKERNIEKRRRKKRRKKKEEEKVLKELGRIETKKFVGETAS